MPSDIIYAACWSLQGSIFPYDSPVVSRLALDRSCSANSQFSINRTRKKLTGSYPAGRGEGGLAGSAIAVGASYMNACCCLHSEVCLAMACMDLPEAALQALCPQCIQPDNIIS